jgi:WD40 repeat protein
LPVGAPAKLGVINGRTIYTAAGKRIAVPVPANHSLQSAEPAKDGWIVDTWQGESGPGVLWHLTSSGKFVKLIGGIVSGWSVSPDGTVLYVGVIKEGFRAIDIATGRVTARHTVNSGQDYHSTAGGGPGNVVVLGGTGGEAPPLGVWDVAGNKIRDINETVIGSKVLSGNKLLLGFVVPMGDRSQVCLATVPLDSLPAKLQADGPCAPGETSQLEPSPSGKQVVLSYHLDSDAQGQWVVPRTGNGAAVALPSLAGFTGLPHWETEDAVLITGFDQQDALTVIRCRVSTKRCERAPLQAGIPAKGTRALSSF